MELSHTFLDALKVFERFETGVALVGGFAGCRAKFTDQSLPGASVFEDAAIAIREAGLTVVRMDMPGTINYDPNQPGESAIDMEAVYVNWLVGNGFVLATGFGVQQWDESAKRAIEGYFPERDVHMISTPTIWYYGGGVHCVTNDQPGKDIIH